MKKRIFDAVLAIALAPFAFCVCALLAPFVWLDTRASPLFLQERLGRNREVFVLIKLRTMRSDTPTQLSHKVTNGQITALGSILRKLKIDELPQIWNVLRGDMSFVGPRPGLALQTELSLARTEMGVFSLRPGITGPSQVAGIDMSEPERLAKSDARYLTEWSLRHDILLLIATVSGKGFGDAARRPRG